MVMFNALIVTAAKIYSVQCVLCRIFPQKTTQKNNDGLENNPFQLLIIDLKCFAVSVSAYYFAVLTGHLWAYVTLEQVVDCWVNH